MAKKRIAKTNAALLLKYFTDCEKAVINNESERMAVCEELAKHGIKYESWDIPTLKNDGIPRYEKQIVIREPSTLAEVIAKLKNGIR